MADLHWWAELGDAVGGFATAAGLVFAVWQVATWKSGKLRERRADVAAALGRNVNATCDALDNALRNPGKFVTPEALDPATPPFVALAEMRQGFLSNARRASGPIDALQKELMVALFYFDFSELEACTRVVSSIAADHKAIEQGYDAAVRLLPKPEARSRLEAAFVERCDAVKQLRLAAIDSLRAAAGYSEHVGTLTKAWRMVMQGYRSNFGEEWRPR